MTTGSRGRCNPTHQETICPKFWDFCEGTLASFGKQQVLSLASPVLAICGLTLVLIVGLVDPTVAVALSCRPLSQGILGAFQHT